MAASSSSSTSLTSDSSSSSSHRRRRRRNRRDKDKDKIKIRKKTRSHSKRHRKHRHSSSDSFSSSDSESDYSRSDSFSESEPETSNRSKRHKKNDRTKKSKERDRSKSHHHKRRKHKAREVGAQTQVELKDKQLRVEDALNASKAAIEEGVVVGGGCCLLRLSMKVDGIKNILENDEQMIGAEIFKRALSYPANLIAKNAGVNGSVVIDKVLSNNDMNYGYNAATGSYEDLMKAGIMDPSKVVRCCLEHAASVAKTFLTSDAVVVDLKERKPIPRRTPMPTSGNG